jgi:HAD superfamily hydrolase (TIGR01509 family)
MIIWNRILRIMLKAIIFDMDGVIIDSEPIYYRVISKFLKDFNISISKEEYSSYIGKSAHTMWDSLKKKYNLEMPVEELIELSRKNYIEYMKNSDEVKAAAGIEELIRDLYKNKLRLAVASSSSSEIINTVLGKLDLGSNFEVIVSGDDVKEGKTSPRIFLLASEKLKVKPCECVVVEDSCDGTISSKLAGMKCVAVKNLNFRSQDLDNADLVIDNFSEVNFHSLFKLCSKN